MGRLAPCWCLGRLTSTRVDNQGVGGARDGFSLFGGFASDDLNGAPE